MTDVTSGSATARMTRTGRVYVGWRYAQAHPDPGPPPRRPDPPAVERPETAPSEVERIRRYKAAGRRRAENLLNRPLKIVAAGVGIGACCFIVAAMSGMLPWTFAGLALIACAVVFGVVGNAIWQGERVVRLRADAERAQVEREHESRERDRTAAHEEHARAHRDWERRREVYEAQQEWHPVSVPPGVDRVDIAGGTLAGWSAVVTMMGAARLAAGSRVTVLDLSEGAVAGDLLRLAGDHGDDPLVWVLPTDLPRLDLTKGLGPEQMADVLSLVVGAGEERSGIRDLSFDNAILERIIRLLEADAPSRPQAGPEAAGSATIPQITAALRVLAQVGDPRDDIRLGLLTEEQLERITTMFGRGAADQVVIEHAWALESQLRKLTALGTDPVWLPPSRLQVVTMDRRAGVLTNRVLGTYVATALTHVLRDSPVGQRWDHTLFLCGAEKLRGDVLDRLIDAAETTGTGLVLMYRSIPAHVRERLGRGHAAVGFMRLGNAVDAGFAADHIGVAHPLLVAEVTDIAGKAVADLKSTPYASTVGAARVRSRDVLTDPVWSPLPVSDQGDAALVRGITVSTAWARSVGRDGRRRSRELRVEQHQMQELPPTAMVFTHATTSGRRVVLVDANPGIMTLPTAHTMEYEEYEEHMREQAVLDRTPDEKRVERPRPAGKLAEQEQEQEQKREPSGRRGERRDKDKKDAKAPAMSGPTSSPSSRAPRARHAARRGAAGLRGAGPHGAKTASPLRPGGEHAASGDRSPAVEQTAPNHDPPAERLDSRS